MMRRRNERLRALVALWLTLFAFPAFAQSVYTVNATTAGNFGNLAAATTGTTVFNLAGTAASGVVTVVSGTGGNIPSGTKAAATITIRCNAGSTTGQKCPDSGHNIVSVRVGPRSIGANRMSGLSPTNFQVTTVTNVSNVRYPGDGSVIFDLTGFTNTGNNSNQNQTLAISFNQGILGDNASTVTTASGGFYVSVLKGSGQTPATSGTNGTFSAAAVRRGLTMTTVDPLSFGVILRTPSTASGTSTIAVGSDTPTLSGTGLSQAPSGTAKRAEFSLTGQTSTAISLSLPANPLVLTRAGGSETVNVNLTLTTTAGTVSTTGTLSGASPGVLTQFVGGVLTIASGTANGQYSGSFTLTANYN